MVNPLIIRKHYLDLKSPAEAAAFFGILPKKVEETAPDPAAFPAPDAALAIAV